MHFGSQLCFVFRHFPLTTIYPMAQHAAETAEAAGAQGRFWEVHNYLFKHQRSLCDKMLLRYAATLELDVERFEREIAEHVYAPKVHEDLQSGIESGVNGTPTFFINGKRENGVQDFSALVNAITREVT
jgi:protein-disulfide isomerase